MHDISHQYKSKCPAFPFIQKCSANILLWITYNKNISYHEDITVPQGLLSVSVDPVRWESRLSLWRVYTLSHSSFQRTNMWWTEWQNDEDKHGSSTIYIWRRMASRGHTTPGNHLKGWASLLNWRTVYLSIPPNSSTKQTTNMRVTWF